MIEDYVRDFLASKLAVPVYLSVPKDHPSEYYSLEKTGQSQTNHIWESVFALQAYGDSYYNAAALMEDANNAMLNDLIKLDHISDVELNGSSNYTDTTKKQPRYQSVFVITHY